MNVVLRIKDALTLPTREDLLYVAERQKARIIARTGRGTDFNGRTFKAYSPAYEKKKVKSGRNARVDLTWSGRMLKALVTHADSDRKGFRIGIYGEEGTRAAAHNAGEGHMPERKFVAVNPADLNAMAKDLGERMLARANQTSLNAAA